ncbi:MAG: hypothetical protein LBL48_12235 [Azoarcus sp.]|jgi:hypothetical protein|nr:hypothetical protein [Azoarcus sp.]
MAIPLIIQRGLEEILPAEKPSPCMNCDEFKKKDGYVTVFINDNGLAILKEVHASIFVGRGSDKDRILFGHP